MLQRTARCLHGSSAAARLLVGASASTTSATPRQALPQLPPIGSTTSQARPFSDSLPGFLPHASPVLHVAASPSHFDEETDEQQERRAWLEHWRDQHGKLEMPVFADNCYAVSFTRSSGPGGQNVNKLSTKARVQLALSAVTRHDTAFSMPRAAIQHLVEHSKYYTASTHALSVTDDTSRTQTANLASAYRKLHAHLEEVLSQDLVGKTSEETRARVKSHVAREQARKRQQKIKRSSVKQGRGKVVF